MSFALAEEALEFIDAETGTAIDGDAWVKESRPGQVMTKTLTMRNISPYTVTILGFKTADPRLLAVSFPKDTILQSGGTADMTLEYDVPIDRISPPSAIWEVEAAVMSG